MRVLKVHAKSRPPPPRPAVGRWWVKMPGPCFVPSLSLGAPLTHHHWPSGDTHAPGPPLYSSLSRSDKWQSCVKNCSPSIFWNEGIDGIPVKRNSEFILWCGRCVSAVSCLRMTAAMSTLQSCWNPPEPLCSVRVTDLLLKLPESYCLTVWGTMPAQIQPLAVF